MASLLEKREKVNALKSEVTNFEKQLAELKTKAKTKEITKEDLDTIDKDRDTISKALEAKKAELKTASDEADAEEKALIDFAEKAKEDNAERKNKNMPANKKDYLKSKQAMADFGAIIASNSHLESEDIKKAWAANLVEKGITSTDGDGNDILLPQAVVSSISDALEASGSIFATFHNTGLDVYREGYNSNTTGDDSRAHGFIKGKTKKEQSIALADKIVRAGYVYKYITIDRETLRENQDTNAVINYVLSELPQRIVREIEMTAIIGDGRDDTDEGKVKSFEPVIKAGAPYVASATGTGDLLVDLVQLDAKVKAAGSRYLVMARETLGQLKTQKNAQGQLIYALGTDFASVLGVQRIFTPDWFAADNADALVVEYVGDAYQRVGDTAIDSFDNFKLSVNQHEYLQEIWSGGALTKLNSGAVLKPKPAA